MLIKGRSSSILGGIGGPEPTSGTNVTSPASTDTGPVCVTRNICEILARFVLRSCHHRADAFRLIIQGTTAQRLK